jgi:hypothetical protein
MPPTTVHNRKMSSHVPRLQSVRGQRVAFTGKLSERREDVQRRVRRCRGLVQSGVSGVTDVVVQGEPSPTYKWGDVGRKLQRVMDERHLGNLIYVITELELQQLLEGRSLSRAQSQAAAGLTLSPLGVPYRQSPKNGVVYQTGSKALTLDLDERDRRLREHFALTDRAARVLQAVGLVPLSPVGQECAYDLAWVKGKSFQVLEVKTTTLESEVQQMRLGLGQVLEYRTWLRLQKSNQRVDAHLLVSEKPTHNRTVAACKAAGVGVWWPSCLQSLPKEPS